MKKTCSHYVDKTSLWLILTLPFWVVLIWVNVQHRMMSRCHWNDALDWGIPKWLSCLGFLSWQKLFTPIMTKISGWWTTLIMKSKHGNGKIHHLVRWFSQQTKPSLIYRGFPSNPPRLMTPEGRPSLIVHHFYEWFRITPACYRFMAASVYHITPKKSIQDGAFQL